MRNYNQPGNPVTPTYSPIGQGIPQQQVQSGNSIMNSFGDWWNQTFVQPTNRLPPLRNEQGQDLYGKPDYYRNQGIDPRSVPNLSSAPTAQVNATQGAYPHQSPNTVPQSVGFTPVGVPVNTPAANPVVASAGNTASLSTAPSIDSSAGSQYTAEALAQNTSPIALTGAQWDNIGNLPGNQEGGFLNGLGDSNVNPMNWTAEGMAQGLQLGQGLFNAYTGYEQLKLGQDQFEFSKSAWEQDFAQRKDAYDYNKAKDESKWAALS